MKTANRVDISGGWLGFSLMELLIVIAIVTLLLALLLPAVAHSREKAKKVSCQSVLRQVYLLTRMYADDHNGDMPLRSALFPNGKFLDCPSTPKSETAFKGRGGRGGYSWNAHYFHHLESRRIDPQWTLVGDRIPWHDPSRTWEPPPNQGWIGGHNLIYGDGRLAWVRLSSPP